VTTTDLPLLVLGRAADPDAERGVECPGALPAAADPDLVQRARLAKAALGDRLLVLGHHYQRDEVIQFADVTGDSFTLAREAAARPDAPYIVFCGVHFMAESADILTTEHQQVILPDLAAGCSMADMARLEQVEDAWDVLGDAGIAALTVPVTYMNSSADIKAFCGRNGGAVCTSSNARQALAWAFDRGEKVLFLPDQHLGRNTAVLELGFSLDDCVVFDPHRPDGGLTPEQLRAASVILWRGHCSVHGRFSPECVDAVRERIPGVRCWCTRSAGTRSSPRPTWSGPRSSSSRRSRRPQLVLPGPSAPSSTSCSGWRCSIRTRRSRSWTRRSASARR